jgi:hypothetical protein
VVLGGLVTPLSEEDTNVLQLFLWVYRPLVLILLFGMNNRFYLVSPVDKNFLKVSLLSLITFSV